MSNDETKSRSKTGWWSRRSRALMFVVAACLVGATVAAFTFAQLGGQPADTRHPYVWDDEPSIVVVFNNVESYSEGCKVTPQQGDPQVYEAPRNRVMDVQRLELEKQFTGPAEVTCPQGRVFTGWQATIADSYATPMMLLLPIAVIVAAIRVRRKKNDNSFDPGQIRGRPGLSA